MYTCGCVKKKITSNQIVAFVYEYVGFCIERNGILPQWRGLGAKCARQHGTLEVTVHFSDVSVGERYIHIRS